MGFVSSSFIHVILHVRFYETIKISSLTFHEKLRLLDCTILVSPSVVQHTPSNILYWICCKSLHITLNDQIFITVARSRHFVLSETLKSCRGCLFPDVYVHLNVLDLSPSNTFSLRIVNKNISRIFPGEVVCY